VVGVFSLTEARSSTLIGVFISVTTMPAASDIGASLAFGGGSEARGSTFQLLLNVTVLAVVAILGLPAQRALCEESSDGGHDRIALTATSPSYSLRCRASGENSLAADPPSEVLRAVHRSTYDEPDASFAIVAP
jgi:hypothetical protein